LYQEKSGTLLLNRKTKSSLANQGWHLNKAKSMEPGGSMFTKLIEREIRPILMQTFDLCTCRWERTGDLSVFHLFPHSHPLVDHILRFTFMWLISRVARFF
jgi:hypothetical protein